MNITMAMKITYLFVISQVLLATNEESIGISIGHTAGCIENRALW